MAQLPLRAGQTFRTKRRIDNARTPQGYFVLVNMGFSVTVVIPTPDAGGYVLCEMSNGDRVYLDPHTDF